MKYIIIIIITAISVSASAQFSVKTETEYLELINKSSDKMLHKQNYHNAELVCDTLFLKSGNPMGARFLVELAKSYCVTKNWNMAVFSIIRQRATFPNDSMESKGISILKRAALHLNLTNDEIKMIIERTKKGKYAGHQIGWYNAITTSFYLTTNKLDASIHHLYELYKTMYPKDKNMILEEIKTMIAYNIPTKRRTEVINREAENRKDWVKNMSQKQRMVFLRKEIKYYKKNKAKRQARVTLKEYKSQGMNLWQSSYYVWKWVWI